MFYINIKYKYKIIELCFNIKNEGDGDGKK